MNIDCQESGGRQHVGGRSASIESGRRRHQYDRDDVTSGRRRGVDEEEFARRRYEEESGGSGRVSERDSSFQNEVNSHAARRRTWHDHHRPTDYPARRRSVDILLPVHNRPFIATQVWADASS